MGILDLLDEATTDKKVFENHPVELLNLEEQLLYLQGLSLILNVDDSINENQKSYIDLLIHSWDLDESVSSSIIDFSKNPDIEIVKSFFSTFKNHNNMNNFIFDAFMMKSKVDKTNIQEQQLLAITKIANNLKVNEQSLDAIDTLQRSLINDYEFNDAINNHRLNVNMFSYLADFYNLKLMKQHPPQYSILF